MRILYSTQKLLKELNVSFSDPGEVSSSEGLGNWYANLLRIERRKCLLFTNEKSLYSFLVPAVLKENLKHIEQEFLVHLMLNLKYEGFGPKVLEKVSAEYRQIGFSKTASRSVLGSMNDIAYHYEVYIHMDGGIENAKILQINHKINRMPMSAIGYKYSIEALRKVVEETENNYTH
ncbi:MAG: hypothetical protein K8I01_12135 [Candidatus Methylomirabilis sp.]|nr:hypothetical protein [Deltaproteobacteria bacterium]